MKKLTKFLSLDFSLQIQIVMALVLLTVTYLLVQFLPFNIFQKVYKISLKLPILYRLELSKTSIVIRSIKMAASILPKHFVCLPQALVFKFLYRGIPNLSMKIGVKKEKNKLLSHAWVQLNDKFLIGDLPDFDYMPIWELQ